jgi:hypothetical protein
MLLRLLGIVTGLLIFWGTGLNVPSATGFLDYTQSGDNTSTQFMAALMVVLPVLGGVAGGTWTRFGFGAGAALVSAAWAVCAVAVTIDGAGGAIGGGEPVPTIALAVFSAAAVAGTATFVLGVRARTTDDPSPPVPGGQWVVGVGASIALALGLMLPGGGDKTGFVERNLDVVNEPMNLAWLALVAAFGAVGVIGFASRSPFGLAAVVASLVPLAWMMLVYRKTLDYAGEPGVTLVKTYEVHHLVLYAAITQTVAVTIGIVTATAHAVGTDRS